MNTLLRVLLPILGLAFAAAGIASAQTPIPGGTYAAPYIIDKPGSYCLTGNRTVTDVTKNVIEISAPDVTLDLGGFTLSFPSDPKTTARGVWIDAGENVEVRNGTISNAYTGISALYGGKGVRVIDVRIASPLSNGMYLTAEDSFVERCHVNDAGDTGIIFWAKGGYAKDCMISAGAKTVRGLTLFTGGRVTGTVIRGGSYGLSLYPQTVAENCIVTETTKLGVDCSEGSTVRNCQISGNASGLKAYSSSVALYGNRFFGNSVAHITGTYTSGGSNLIP